MAQLLLSCAGGTCTVILEFSANETLFRSSCSKVLIVAPFEISTMWWKGPHFGLSEPLRCQPPHFVPWNLWYALSRGVRCASHHSELSLHLLQHLWGADPCYYVLISRLIKPVIFFFLNDFIILPVLNLPKLKFKKKNEAINNFLWPFLNLNLFFKMNV